MKKNDQATLRMGRAPIVLAALIVALGVGIHPSRAQAVVDCAQFLALDVIDPGTDSDSDGFTDFQECNGITTAGAVSRTFPSCVSADGAVLSRDQCVDPNTKDLFAIYRPASTGSLLSGLPNPFAEVTFHGITFRGLTDLGVTVHQLAEAEAAADRRVSAISPQKAVRIAESLDTNGTILGNCQWGTPLGLDGCVVYTRRARNFIDATCNNAGDATTDRNQVFLAYATYLVLHETGHSLGGLTTDYNSRFGGYHYKAGSAIVMEQFATYSTKGGKCTWHISSGWNTTLDPAGVTLTSP